MVNPILDTRKYALISGFAVGTIGILGIVLNLIGKPDLLGADFLAFDWTHNIVHLVLAMAGTFVGFDLAPKFCNLYAKGFGIVYVGLGVVGFFAADLAILHLELGENIVHILIGVWGLAAGFLGTTESVGLGQKAEPAAQ